MLALLKIENLKTFLIVGAIIAAVIFWKDYQYQIGENNRQTENMEQVRKFDSLKFASQTYTKKEIDEYLEYNRSDLKDFLNKYDIKTRRLEKIITQSLEYRDTTSNNIDLSPILQAIKNNTREISVPVIDSTDCLIVKGFVIFKNDTLSLNITDRKFKNKSDVVQYWERNQWNFLGIKTRLFGKKSTTVIIKDSCGNTETFIIDAKKKS